MDYLDQFFAAAEQIIHTLDRAPIERAVDALYGAWRADGVVFTMGNGGQPRPRRTWPATWRKSRLCRAGNGSRSWRLPTMYRWS
ncbi:MAG: SIS domain-containing protein, partial [Anaerolineae bacterium]|nr:SIS domain-containing protein [Anaerolineae bacterium]